MSGFSPAALFGGPRVSSTPTPAALSVICLCRAGTGDRYREAPLNSAPEEPLSGEGRGQGRPAPPSALPPGVAAPCPLPRPVSCELPDIHLIMCPGLLTSGSSPPEPQRFVILLQKQTIALRGCASQSWWAQTVNREGPGVRLSHTGGKSKPHPFLFRPSLEQESTFSSKIRSATG